MLSALTLFTACNTGGGEGGGGSTPGGSGEGGGNGGGGTTPTGTDYTVTVLDPDGNALAGVTLKFTYGKNETDVLTTGADGKATANIDTLSDVYVELVSHDGYGSPFSKKADRRFDGVTEKTVKLTRLATVIAVDESGNALAGVSIQICHSQCLLPKTSGEDGKVSASLPADYEGDIKFTVTAVPEGYDVPEAADGTNGENQVYTYFESGSYVATIVIPSK